MGDPKARIMLMLAVAVKFPLEWSNNLAADKVRGSLSPKK
jgi:hypothetical protein